MTNLNLVVQILTIALLCTNALALVTKLGGVMRHVDELESRLNKVESALASFERLFVDRALDGNRGN